MLHAVHLRGEERDSVDSSPAPASHDDTRAGVSPHQARGPFLYWMGPDMKGSVIEDIPAGIPQFGQKRGNIVGSDVAAVIVFSQELSTIFFDPLDHVEIPTLRTETPEESVQISHPRIPGEW